MGTKKALAVVKKKELVIQGSSPADMIRMAVEGKANLTDLKELLAIQKDWEANEARKIFTSAFARVQANIAAVIKTKVNPQTHSKYADLGDIIESAKPIYTKEGFSVIFYEGETVAPESIRVCADILHTAGHKETYHYDVPLDGKGLQGNANMTKIHGKSSSVSYGRRYLMCMIWNIPTQDDDGNGAAKPVKAVEYINEKQLGQLLDYFAILGDKAKPQFLKYMNLDKFENMAKDDFAKAISALEAARKQKEGK